MDKIYHVTDFDDPAGGFKLANDIADFVSKSEKWELVGPATSQYANDRAAYYATIGRPAIAVRYEGGEGHIMVIMPGMTTKNTTGLDLWLASGVKYVPSAVNYSHGEPKLTCITDKCMVTNGFSDPTGVVYYTRKDLLPF
jgi:hypothetical protein